MPTPPPFVRGFFFFFEEAPIQMNPLNLFVYVLYVTVNGGPLIDARIINSPCREVENSIMITCNS